MKKLIILHENSEWLKPITLAMQKADIPFEEWYIDRQGAFDLFKAPDKALFFNRMSPSAHTRNHFRTYEYTSAILSWLEFHKAKILNGYFSWQMENSKILQYNLLRKFHILIPYTVAAFSKEDILSSAKTFPYPFLLKHNRGGKGTGVHLFRSFETLEAFLHSAEFSESPDGITLIQQYIESEEPCIYRLEFIGKKFFYAVQIDTRGGFELCPADACSLKDHFCPIQSEKKFQILSSFPHKEIIALYEEFLRCHNIDVAGIECVIDKKGQIYTYDVNANTNYNQAAEERAGHKSAYTQLAEFIAETIKIQE
jgi:hypothetical protein